jgi:hypothetical protein
MLRRLMLLALIALLACPVWADVAEGDEPEETKKDQPQDDAEKKKADKYLGIDWGDKDEKESEKDAPDAKKPSKKVDLATALEKVRQKKLGNILKYAEKAKKRSDEAGQAAAGTHKRLKKGDAPKIYNTSGTMYVKVIRDLEKLAKLIKDEDVKLTLLQEHRDPMKDKGCEAFCKAANVVIDLAKSPKSLRKVIPFLKSARQINPKYPGIKEAENAAREKLRELREQIKQARADRSSGGGEKDKDNQYDDGRDERDHKEEGREDYKKTGR